MITHEDGSVTLTETEWLNVRPRWINMEDAHPNNGEVVLCYLLSKHGHKEYRRLSWCDHYGNWDDESGDDYVCDREAVFFWLWEPPLPPLPSTPPAPAPTPPPSDAVEPSSRSR